MKASLTTPERELPSHSFSHGAFREICAGVASRDTMATLLAGEYSRRRLLLRALADVATDFTTGAALSDPEPAWDLLAAVEAVAPDVVSELILHPPFGIWLRRTATAPCDTDRSGARSHCGYLYLVAAAAALRARMPCVLPLPVSSGAIVLPTVGRLRLPAGFPAGTAELRYTGTETHITASDGHVSVRVDTTRANDMFRPAPLHTVTVRGVGLTIWIDDTDPYREFAEPLPPNETGPTELLEWHRLLDETWDTLVCRHPGWAVEAAAGLRTLTPVDPARTSGGFSSAAAIGAVAVPTGLTATDLAETFVHEMQHSKLNAVSNLVDLVSVRVNGHYYAPWRDDPRPLTGMLHGIYAFVAVAEFWLAQGDAGDTDATTADFLLAYRREQIRWALDSLAVADGLTDLGAELVAGVQRRLAACDQKRVEPELTAIAERLVADHYACWRLRNIQPDDGTVAALVDNWRHGRSAGPLQPGVFKARNDIPPSRLDLLRIRVLDPDQFAHAVRAADHSGPSIFRAHTAYGRDDYDDALSRYLLARDYSGDVVVGIGLCLRAKGDHDAARAILARPEIVAGVCTGLDGFAVDVDPVAVATWLVPMVGTVVVGAA